VEHANKGIDPFQRGDSIIADAPSRSLSLTSSHACRDEYQPVQGSLECSWTSAHWMAASALVDILKGASQLAIAHPHELIELLLGERRDARPWVEGLTACLHEVLESVRAREAVTAMEVRRHSVYSLVIGLDRSGRNCNQPPDAED
jgi:hypothetical protein